MARIKRKTDPKLLKELIAEYNPQGLSDISDMLKDLFADTIETMLQSELDTSLGYDKSSQQPKDTTNRRNGSYPKTVQSSSGEIELSISRDRTGDYEPSLIPKGKKDISEIEEKIIKMYAKGTSDRDISDTVNDIYGFDVSHETISNIVDKIQPLVIEWQNRTLDRFYPFVYMDALYVPIKSDGKASKHAVYTIIGVNCDGKKDSFGFWVTDSEGTYGWMSIFDELKARGVNGLGFVCIDGLPGLEDVITNSFPNAVVCRCMVHLMRKL